MIKSVFYIIFFVLRPNFTSAQINLVPNGDFEEYLTCPSSNYPYYYVDRADDWFMPSTGSSDYFNSCSMEFDALTNSFLFSVPQNYTGYQYARSGHGYAGYYAALTPENDNYYEYVSVKLLEPLEKNRFYRLTYYLSLADSTFKEGSGQYLQVVNHSGAYFSHELEISANDLRIIATPQVYNDPNVFLKDSMEWQKVEGIFVAEGEEQYLTIGYFFDYTDIAFNYAAQIDKAVTAYYYIDDVSLVELDIDMPNVLTPNGDGINDVAFKFENIQNLEVEILNRWGNVVNEITLNEGWLGDDKNGQQLVEGVYFYILKRENTKLKTGFIQLIR